MKTTALFFPFDLFGSSGAKAGAELLADAFQEMLEDNKREKAPTRARAYSGKVRFEEFLFETIEDYAAWRVDARAAIREILDRGDFLLWIAGNHLGALPLYEELGGAASTLVIQLDAHLDIFNLSDCTTELSHGNFLLHAETPLPPIMNLGHRDLLLRPDHIAGTFERAIASHEILTYPANMLSEVRRRCASAERVVLDIDCDVFDPAYFPAVAQPLPFGLSPHFVMPLIDAIGVSKLAALSISEFEPARDVDDRCLATLMWLIEHVLLLKYEKKPV